MKKIELLSPVGNIKTMYQAIHNGADAIYLAGTSYGARKFAENFTNEELIDVIKYAHLYGVKVYITVNTLIYEYEFNDCLNYIEFLHKNGVDAIIVQDLGIIKAVREKFPNLEIHASTQCHNYNNEGISLLKSLGVTRVVMAREMSLTEINNINVDIEKEVFIHGALCVSYSGCCLFSSLNGGRSGNRGECVGSCRLPYKLIKNNNEIILNDKYLLSTKELNTINHLDKIIESGIDSLKIEGRMKSPYYVGYVTRLYRTLIDKYYNNEELTLSNEELINLKKLYNREFTGGYLFNDNNIMNTKTPNHQGIEIGKVIDVDKKYIKIKLTNDSLSQNDGIRFKNTNLGMMVNRLYDKNKLLVNNVQNNNICYLDNKLKINKNDILIKTIDSNLINNLEKYSTKKIDINIIVECYLNNKLKITVSDGINEVSSVGSIIDNAIKREVTESDIIKCVNKLGNTPFSINDIKVKKDNNIFISLSNINETRRDVIDKLINIRENKKQDVIINEINDNYIIKNNNKITINALVRNIEQLNCCLDNNIDNIYITDYNLYNEYKHLDNIYYKVDRLDNNKYLNAEKLLVSEIGNIYKYKNNNKLIGDYYLNVTNSSTIKYLSNQGLDRVTLSVELDDYNLKGIMNNNYNVELIVYGRLELMLMKYCPLKQCLNYCEHCKKNNDLFYLENDNKERFPILRNNCITHIMHSKNINKIDNINDYLNMNINNFRLELFDEGYNEVNKLINEIKSKIGDKR